MKAHLRYLQYVLRHKWFVFVAGRVLGLSLWQLFIHDFSKFGPAEWGPYVRRFHGGRGGVMDKDTDDEAFRLAWKHHWQHNPHHPEFWVKGERGDPSKFVPMPERFVREMVADWYGAGMAQGKPDCWTWYLRNREHYPITAEAHAYVVELLGTLEARGMIPPRVA